MGWNHDLQSSTDCTNEQYQTTVDRGWYETRDEHIPGSTEAVTGSYACGENSTFSILTDFYTFLQLTTPRPVSHMAIFVCSRIVSVLLIKR